MKKIDISEGFFVVSIKDKGKTPFVSDEHALNRLPMVSEKKMGDADEVKFILPKGVIAIDADSKEAADKIDKLLLANNINTFSYPTSQGHKHYWFSVPEKYQRYINEYKLNSNSKVIALDEKIDTRSFNDETQSTGAIYLKSNGKEKAGRPKPAELLEKIKNLPPVPLYLLHPKELGVIPGPGEGWSNAALPMIGKMKFAKYPLEDILQVFGEAANYNGYKRNDYEVKHKYDDALEIPWNKGGIKSIDTSVHEQFFNDCVIRKMSLIKKMLKIKKTLQIEELAQSTSEEPNSNDDYQMKINQTNLNQLKIELRNLESIIDKVNYTPDWLALKLHEKKTNVIFSLGDTTRVEKRIIEANKLSKYDGLLMENNKPINEKLEEKVFRQLRKESRKCGYLVDTKIALEVARRVISVVEAPYDNKDIITFNNCSLDWKKTFANGEVFWLDNKVKNHNPVKWDYYPEEELLKSPAHKKMADFMDDLFKKIGVAPKIVFKIGAYTMCKDNFADKVFFFHGKGGEGKSQISLFIREMFNEYSCKNYDPINPITGAEMAFVGSQIVYNDEVTSSKINLKHIKPVATGGAIHVRPLYQNGKDHIPYSTMIFNTNHSVDVGGDATSDAIKARIFILKFDGPDLRGTPAAMEYKRISPSTNKEFMEVFVSRCVKHIPALLKEEFIDEESKQINNQESMLTNNSVKLFINEFDPTAEYFDRNIGQFLSLPLIKGEFTTITELYTYYKNWAASDGYKVFNKTKFKEHFKDFTKIQVDDLISTKKDGRSGRWISLKTIITKEKNENN